MTIARRAQVPCRVKCDMHNSLDRYTAQPRTLCVKSGFAILTWYIRVYMLSRASGDILAMNNIMLQQCDLFYLIVRKDRVHSTV